MRQGKTKHRAQLSRRRVVIVGAGAIGSWLGNLVARNGAVESALIVDPQAFEPKNAVGQDVLPEECGQPKAKVIANRMRRINPRLNVEWVQSTVEEIPLGKLRGAILLGALDNRGARRYVNQVAHWLNAPAYIDAGVEREGNLARVSVYHPSEKSACMQCAWENRDYALLETRYPCKPGGEIRATNAPAGLGCVAAALQTLELEKLLANGDDASQTRQITYCLSTHRSFITQFRRNPRCLCDHVPWKIGELRLTHKSTVEDILQTARGQILRVDGQTFTTIAQCNHCGRREIPPRLAHRMPRCRKCGEKMIAPGDGQFDFFNPTRKFSLRQLGLLSGDIVAVARGKKILRYELIFHGAA